MFLIESLINLVPHPMAADDASRSVNGKEQEVHEDGKQVRTAAVLRAPPNSTEIETSFQRRTERKKEAPEKEEQRTRESGQSSSCESRSLDGQNGSSAGATTRRNTSLATSQRANAATRQSSTGRSRESRKTVERLSELSQLSTESLPTSAETFARNRSTSSEKPSSKSKQNGLFD